MLELIHTVSYEETIKKSLFIVHAAPVQSGEEALRFVEEHSKVDATHNCWAFRIGDEYRFNDDGEPGGTAGRPILAAIEGRDLTNIVVLVIRFYGGIKLGTGGLVRAYGGCAGQCLALAEKIELIEKKMVQFACQFNEWAILQYELNSQQIEYQEDYTANGVVVQALMQVHQIDPLRLKLQDVSRGREQLKIIEEDQHD